MAFAIIIPKYTFVLLLRLFFFFDHLETVDAEQGKLFYSFLTLQPVSLNIASNFSLALTGLI